MAVSKVILNGNTLIDVTDKTVTSSTLVSPNTALGADGTTVTGALVTKSASDVTVSGATTTIPAGVYSSQVQKTVSSGSATTPATTITVNPSISVSSNGLITVNANSSQRVTPSVNIGYVRSGTAGTITVSGSKTQQLTVQAAQTITPTTTNQTIASGRYLTGTQTIKGDANLVASNIKKDVQIFGVTGSYEGSGGGGSDLDAKKDVNFIDYDGTLLYSYTASEFANLSALPANPSHEGLVAQGWNWSLANAKTYVASYGKLWIGQMYITESGDTEIDVELQAPRLSPWLSLAVNGTVEVDWGDGSTKTTITGASQTTQKKTNHVYATDGSYTIKIHVVSGSFNLYGSSTCSIFSGNFSNVDNNRVYANDVKRVRIGSSVTGIITYAFYNCYSLDSITIPSGVTSIDDYAFANCSSLASVTIPSGVTSIDDYAFNSCRSLTSITIPSGITSIGTYTFANCSSLASVTIPSGVTSIATYAFNGCYSLASITIPSGITSIGASAFYNCYSLASITIPSGVTSIGDNAFYNCRSLTSITIPSGITSIAASAFSSCSSLASITIPSGVTSIAASAFSNCCGIGLIRFEQTTPPTVANSSAWRSIPTDCVIHVPSGSRSRYTSATNYPSSSTYTYVED